MLKSLFPKEPGPGLRHPQNPPREVGTIFYQPARAEQVMAKRKRRKPQLLGFAERERLNDPAAQMRLRLSDTPARREVAMFFVTCCTGRSPPRRSLPRRGNRFSALFDKLARISPASAARRDHAIAACGSGDLSAAFPMALAAMIDPGWWKLVETAAVFSVGDPILGHTY
jgi:hypothetical protein